MHARLFSATRSLKRSTQNHYEVLGVKVSATADEIKRQFFELSKRYHPDRNADADPEKYQQITQAYTVLSDTTERKKFDEQLGTAVRQPQGYHSGRSWNGNEPQRKSGISRYNYNAQMRKYAEQSHEMRHSSKLDPLRPEYRSRAVPHFDFSKHAETHLRNDRRRRESLNQTYSSPIQPKTAATKSMGSSQPFDPQNAGISFMFKAMGAIGAGASFMWLLLR